MEAVLASLHQFLHAGGFEHLLIVPSRSMGSQLLDRYAARYGGAMGLRVETPASLARELCARRGLARPLLADAPAALLVLRLLKAAYEDPARPLSYFPALGEGCLTLSTARELLRVFHLLEQEGLAGLPHALTGQPRLADVDRLYRQFQAEKQAQGLWDRFDLFREATALVETQPLSIPTAFCSNLAARGVVRRFLQTACPAPTVLSLPFWREAAPTPALFWADFQAPVAPKLRFAQGYGQDNEVLFPFYDLLERGYPLGQVSILCTHPAYLPLLQDHAARLRIPLTLGDGLPLDTAPLCQLVGQLAAWYQEDCPAEGLADLLAGGLVFPHGAALLRFLRKNNVGFHLERWQNSFTHALEALPDGEEEALRARLEDWQALVQQLQALFSPQITPAEGMILLGRLLTQCYVRFHPQQGTGAYAALMQLADDLLPQQHCPSFAAFLPLLLELAPSAVWQSASPRDGAVHVSLLPKGTLLGRPCTYVLGLGRDSLTAPEQESPLLRDEERRSIGLPPSDSEGALPLCHLALLLGCAQGEVILSYPSYDTNRMLALPPDPVYEQLRGAQDAPLFGYRRAVGFTAADRWLSDGTCPPLPVYHAASLPLSQFVKECRFSASALEMALECPRHFYFQYIIGLPQPTRSTLSPEHWLAPNQLGSLVHLALERYFNAMIQGTSDPDFDAIWSACLAEAKQQYPCLSPRLMEQDGTRAEGMARRAVAQFVRQQPRTVPLAAELSFGAGPECRMVDGQPFQPPEEFYLKLDNTRSIRFTGTVDRLDRLPDGRLSIVDYKTGSDSNFLRGWDHKLQYHLYALAVEQLLGKPVAQAVYLLLSPGGVRAVPVDDPAHQSDCAARLAALLELLADPARITMRQPIWENGGFSCPEDREDRAKRLSACADYCPYAGICQEVGS